MESNHSTFALGSRIVSPAHWEGGAKATPFFEFDGGAFQKFGGETRGRGGRGVWGEFRRARASGERQRAGLPSKKVRASAKIEDKIRCSDFERTVASPLRGSAPPLCALRKAAESQGRRKEKDASKMNV